MDNKFKLLFVNEKDADGAPVKTPSYAKAGDAGMDLSAKEGGILKPGERKLFKSGISFALPNGVAALVCPRSGLAYKHGITVLNAPGIIDSGYRGDVGVILINLGDEDFIVEPGDRIAQLVFVPFLQAFMLEASTLPETDRGVDGFGSSGRK